MGASIGRVLLTAFAWQRIPPCDRIAIALPTVTVGDARRI